MYFLCASFNISIYLFHLPFLCYYWRCLKCMFAIEMANLHRISCVSRTCKAWASQCVVFSFNSSFQIDIAVSCQYCCRCIIVLCLHRVMHGHQITPDWHHHNRANNTSVTLHCNPMLTFLSGAHWGFTFQSSAHHICPPIHPLTSSCACWPLTVQLTQPSRPLFVHSVKVGAWWYGVRNAGILSCIVLLLPARQILDATQNHSYADQNYWRAIFGLYSHCSCIYQ